ncbi:MAG: pentapeptide repeat-containing protein [Candidatus Cloacimonetes bacterium]|nr:pentapeptide repeat-containing protein [Candidatus Cloacimonadota bacterium]
MKPTNQCLFLSSSYQCQEEPDYPYHYCVLHNVFADESKAINKLQKTLATKIDTHIGYILNNLVVPKTQSLKIKQKQLCDIHIEDSLIDRIFILSSNLSDTTCIDNNFNHLVLDDLLLKNLNINRLNSYRSNIVSCDLEHSLIQRCHLMEGVINDCTFISVHFKDCVFDNFKIRNNQFIDCNFENCKFLNNTMITNQFEGCLGLDSTQFSDCLIDESTKRSMTASPE